MNHTGLFVALAIGLVIGIVFAVSPELDLKIAMPFYNIAIANNKFGLRIYPPLMLAHDLGLWLFRGLAAFVVLALVIKLIRSQNRMMISTRAIVFLLTTLALGPGLLVNVVLKDHWGRPRPIDVTQFGGDEHFVAWWDPRGDCPNNCSFVSGDVSSAFWTLAPAALVPPQWRALAYAGALTLGIGMGALRVMAGGHFFTDVAFAGVFTFLLIWLTYAMIFRWTLPSSSATSLSRRKSRRRRQQ
jgi:lipid A 4'-phosphatase